ncbi:MAG TPA: hypothetical protein PLR91_11160 [Kiritimatiellia bacterium]|nr:hypothetical protein [Kiritimatiellia bacterium]
MNKWKVAAVGVCLIAAGACAGETSRFVNTVSGVSNAVPPGYVPPLVSNGSLCMLIDYLGCQAQNRYVNMTPTIFWAGRRYGPPKDQLIPFGHFETEVETAAGEKLSVPARWTQTLDTRSAHVSCRNVYGNGLTVETDVFCPFAGDLVVVRKRVSAANAAARSARLTFTYRFTATGNENKAPRRVTCASAWNDASRRAEFRFQADAHRPCEGLVAVFADRAVAAAVDGQTAALSADLALDGGKPVEVTFCLLFADSLDGKDFEARAAKLQALALRQGFDGLFAEHRKAWDAYWDESFVRLPDARLETAYNTAQYHLRANATRWSFPVGIFNTHWAGRFFGWDEMFCYQALVSSNHRDIARRGPEFRRAGLKVALDRAAHYGKLGLFGARYPWETLEDSTEASPPGFWMEHVFHMSNIALAAWYQYLYTEDPAYLENTGYPVIRECARFFFANMVYDLPDGRVVIGKCTDLERLGPAKANPFMTSCGAIYTLEAASRAASLLKMDETEAAAWTRTAAKLRESLPEENGRFVPYAGCRDESVATLGGLFPYPVFDETEPRQRAAAYHYMQHGRAFGNMYQMGTSVCAWYLGWMAAALAELGDTVGPARMLREAADGAGCFGEMFEINEEKVRRCPWFSTASGNVVYALNQMLVQNREGRILLARGVPAAWRDYAFKLACHGDLAIETEVKDGRLTRLALLPGDPSREQQRTVVLPAGLAEQVAFNTVSVRNVMRQEGGVRLDVHVKGPVELVQRR